MDPRIQPPHHEPSEAAIPFSTVTNFKGEQETLHLDVYLPEKETDALRPAVMWIHGGGFAYGNDRHQIYVPWLCGDFAKLGYVCVAPDYRVREQTDIVRFEALKDAVTDCRAALAWLRKNAERLHVDPQRIYVGGGSAGGMTAVSLGALEQDIAAIANLWGSPAPGFMVGEITSSYPPTFTVHGTADQLVDYANSTRLLARLEQLGVPCELLTLEGAPHTPLMYMDKIVKSVASFFERYGAE